MQKVPELYKDFIGSWDRELEDLWAACVAADNSETYELSINHGKCKCCTEINTELTLKQSHKPGRPRIKESKHKKHPGRPKLNGFTLGGIR